MAKKRKYNDDEDQPGTCCLCKKSFDKLSTFLRHVTHSKLCLEAHDKLVIKKMKEDSRLKSKRQWFHKNKRAKEVKEPKNNTTGQSKVNRNWYASKKMKLSDGGKGFYKLFEEVFDECDKLVMSKLEKNAEVSSYLKDSEFDDTMDSFFDEKLQQTYCLMQHEHEYQSPDFILEKAFEKLESTFDEAVEENLKKSRGNWVASVHADMSDGLFYYSWNKALHDYYNDERFVEATQNAQEEALDTIFNKLILTEGYFPDEDNELEAKMISAYQRVLEQEFVNQSKANGFSSVLKEYVEKKWIRKFESSKFSALDLVYDI